MALGQIRLIFSVFGVLLCGVLINVHFFQSNVRERKAGLRAGNRAAIASVDSKVAAAYRDDRTGVQARLRRKGVGTENAEVQRAEIAETVKASQRYAATNLKTSGRGLQKPGKVVRTEPPLRPKAMARPRLTVAAPLKKNVPKASKLVRAVQRELTSRGYEPGPVDGIEGLMTRAAIMAYQHDGGRALSGRSSEVLLRQLVLGGSRQSDSVAMSDRGVKTRRHVTKTVQLRLRSLGYSGVSANGMMSSTTRHAIKEFEKYSGLVPTGRISGRLVGKLSNTPKMRYGARM